jgi:hypothetical protein
MSILSEQNEQVYEQVRAILAEHFPNFLFCVMDDYGDVYYDYTNMPIGKMLMREMQDDINDDGFGDDIIVGWEGDDEDDNSGVWG